MKVVTIGSWHVSLRYLMTLMWKVLCLKIKKNMYMSYTPPRIFFQRKVCAIAENAVRSAAHPGKNTANVSLSVVRGG